MPIHPNVEGIASVHKIGSHIPVVADWYPEKWVWWGATYSRPVVSAGRWHFE